MLHPETKVPDFDDASLTENTRAAYPLETLPAISVGGTGGIPKTVSSSPATPSACCRRSPS